MRRWIIASFAVLLPVTPALAQTPYPGEAVITQPEVLVRSGPSDKFYPTSKLHIGDRVFVRKASADNPGWLEITPPPRSFSWINAKSIDMVDQYNGVVRGSDPVFVRPGSSVSNDPPNTERVKLAPGTQVYVLDKPLKVNGEEWLPIRPHLTDVRYIPAEAVKRESNLGQSPTLPALTPINPLLDQAEQAYRSGDSARAAQLFKEAYEKSNDQNVKIYAHNRLQSMSPPGASRWQPGPGSVAANSVSRQPANTSLYNQSPQQMLIGPPCWSVKGRLRRTGIENNGQPVYVLEDHRGQAVLRVTAAPGLRLRDFEGREIALFGQVVYRSDAYIRTYYMSATHVALY